MPLPYADEALITAPLEAVLVELAGIKSEIAGLRAVIEHIHTGHWHLANATVPKAALLVNEYMGGEDLDGNGLVYGRDFHIAPDCPAKPPMLKSLPNEGTPMSWTEYLGSL